MSKTEIMVYVHGLSDGHVLVGTGRIPVNAVRLSVYDVTLTNIGDASGRLMLTLDRRVAEFHGLTPRPAQVAAPAPQRTIQSQQTAGIAAKAEELNRRSTDLEKPMPQVDINDEWLDSAIAETIVENRQAEVKTALKPGLLARAGVKATS